MSGQGWGVGNGMTSIGGNGQVVFEIWEANLCCIAGSVKGRSNIHHLTDWLSGGEWNKVEIDRGFNLILAGFNY